MHTHLSVQNPDQAPTWGPLENNECIQGLAQVQSRSFSTSGRYRDMSGSRTGPLFSTETNFRPLSYSSSMIELETDETRALTCTLLKLCEAFDQSAWFQFWDKFSDCSQCLDLVTNVASHTFDHSYSSGAQNLGRWHATENKAYLLIPGITQRTTSQAIAVFARFEIRFCKDGFWLVCNGLGALNDSYVIAKCLLSVTETY